MEDQVHAGSGRGVVTGSLAGRRRAMLVVAALVLALVPSVAAAPAEAAEVTLWASPTGTSVDCISSTAPCSLATAQSVVRADVAGMTGDVVVDLEDGTYSMAAPLNFGAGDSGTNGHNVIWQAAPNAHPEFSGGVPVTGWTPVANQPYYEADVSATFNTRQLYVDGARVPVASGQMPGTLTQTSYGYQSTSAVPANWHNQSDINFYYQGSGNKVVWNWSSMSCPVHQIVADGTKSDIYMAEPCWGNLTHASTLPYFYEAAQYPTEVDSALELLDQPGEWYLDRVAHKLYYYPSQNQGDLSHSQVIAPIAQQLINATGTLDAPVHNIVFSGITFDYSTWLGAAASTGFVDVQGNALVTSATGGTTSYPDGKTASQGTASQAGCDDQLWGHDMNRTYGSGDYNGDVHFTTQKTGAWVTFTGTGFDLIAPKNSNYGTLNITVDGVAQTPVSLYAASYTAQQAVLSKTGLTNGKHTLVIAKITSVSNQSDNDGSYVAVDALRVYDSTGGSTVLNDDDPAFQWESGPTCPFGGLTEVPAALSFHAAQNIQLLKNRIEHIGSVGAVFEYGSQNNTVKGNVLDDISGNGVQIGDSNDPNAETQGFGYSGVWDTNSTVHYTTTDGAYARLRFYGTSADLYGNKGPDHGTVSVQLDDLPDANVTENATSPASHQKVYSSAPLPLGWHTITVTKAGGSYLDIDSALVHNTQTPGMADVTLEDNAGSKSAVTQRPDASVQGISFVGAWTYQANRGYGEYANDLHFTSTNGDTATIRFFGTGADLKGDKDYYRGDVRVVLDDGTASTVSAYNLTLLPQQTIYSTPALPLGWQTITTSKLTGTYMDLDAVVVHDTSQTPALPDVTLNDTFAGKVVSTQDASGDTQGFTYSGSGWVYQGGRNQGEYNDDLDYTTTNGASVTMRFYGTSATWMGDTGTNRGHANVVLDGGTATQVTAYASSTNEKQSIYSTPALPLGWHTIVATKVDGTYMDVDALAVHDGTGALPDATVNDDAHSQALDQTASWKGRFTYTGTGSNQDTASSEYNSDEHYTSTYGDTVSMRFYGSGATLKGDIGPSRGNVSISLDGGAVSTFNQHTATVSYQQPIYTASSLKLAWHTITVTKANNDSSSVDVDVLVVQDPQDALADVTLNDDATGAVDAREINSGDNIVDNYLHDAPAEFFGGASILVNFAQDTSISHNQIDDIPYAGIVFGWGGHTAHNSQLANVNQNNSITGNLIFDTHLRVEDGGAIYTAGFQGTNMATGLEISGNVVHDKTAGGWDYYDDIGSRYITLTNNVGYNNTGWGGVDPWGGCHAFGNLSFTNSYQVGPTGWQGSGGICALQDSGHVLTSGVQSLTDSTMTPAVKCASITSTTTNSDGSVTPACASIVAAAGLESTYNSILTGGPQSQLVRSNSSQITYTGTWTDDGAGRKYTSTANSTLSFSFTGTGLDYLDTAAANRSGFTATITDTDAQGIVKSTQTQTASCYSQQTTTRYDCLEVRGLNPDFTHTIVIKDAGPYYVELDMFRVFTQ